MRPKAEYWAIYDAIVVTDKRGSRSYTVEEANDLSDELRIAVREANNQDQGEYVEPICLTHNKPVAVCVADAIKAAKKP